MLSMYTFKDNYMEIRPFSWSFLLWRGDTLSKRSHGIQEIYVNNIITQYTIQSTEIPLSIYLMFQIF